MSNAVYKENPESQVAVVKAMINEHPVYRNYTASEKKILVDLTRAGNIRTESLVEDTIAKYGKFDRNPGSVGDDFHSGQGEVKTIKLGRKELLTPSMKTRGAKVPQVSYYGSISGLVHKTGPLRIVAYNELTEEVVYFFIPADEWPALVMKSGYMEIRYRKRTEDYGKLEKYRTDFKGLCQSINKVSK